MAKQESFIKFRGKIGDISFYKDRNLGFQARMKGGVDGDRVRTDPAFERTRENMAEFGRAVRTGKMLRQQLNTVLFSFTDKTVANRLTSLIHRIQKADPDSPRGERTLLQENAGMLRGFEFNRGVQLSTVYQNELVPTYDAINEVAILEVPAFNPQIALASFPGATHVQFVLAAAELDLESDFPAKAEVVRSDYIPLIGQFSGETLEAPLSVSSDNSVYILVGIAVFQEANGQYYPLNNGEYNALTIAKVES